jgi:hypothetical protein
MFSPAMFQRSWMLFRASLRALMHHPKLLLFPAAAFLSFVVGLAPIVVFMREIGKIEAGTASGALIMAMTPLGFIGPLLPFLMTSLMSGAFYHECPRALSGEPVSLGRGFRAALSRIRVLVVWHLFSFLASYLTRLVGGQFGFGGKIASALVGLGWGVASFFVLPVLMREPKQLPDPIGTVRKSTALLRATWGESVVGFFGMSILSAPLVIIAVAAFLLARGTFGTAAAEHFTPNVFFSGPGVAVIGGMVLWTVAVSLAGAVYRSALYVYATEGVVPEPFDREAMDGAWKIRRT